MSPPVTVKVKRRFSQSAERVFDAFLDPDKAGKFMFATPEGRMVRVEIDPRVGGSYIFVERRGDTDVEHRCTFVEISRPKRIVFDFTVLPYTDVTTRVTIEVAPLGSGCEVTLTHTGVLPDYEKRTEAGWTVILARLTDVL